MGRWSVTSVGLEQVCTMKITHQKTKQVTLRQASQMHPVCSRNSVAAPYLGNSNILNLMEHPHQTMSYLLLLLAWRKQLDSSEKHLTSTLSLTFLDHLHLETQAFKRAAPREAEWGICFCSLVEKRRLQGMAPFTRETERDVLQGSVVIGQEVMTLNWRRINTDWI